MEQEKPSHLLLSFPDQDRVVADPSEINDVLRDFGSAIWPLETRKAPEDIQDLLQQPFLDDAQSRRVMEHFLVPREGLLALVAAAGRTPGTNGGGDLSTTDTTHNVVYPQLYQVLEGVDYSRFDRFHINRGPERTGVDEVMHILCGRGVVLRQLIPDLGEVCLQINCPTDHGWTLTYDGDLPHIGSISGASPATKVLMQIIGPAEWEMLYL